MGVGLFGKGWVPLGLGGSGGSNTRGGGAPSGLQAPGLPGATVYLDDFNQSVLGTLGTPKWFVTPSATGTALLGSPGVGGLPGNAATTAYSGALTMTNGALDDEYTIVESAANAANNLTFNGVSGNRFVFACRFGPGASSATHAMGIALLPPSVAIGTDWVGVTDPATTLGAINALAIYKDTDAGTGFTCLMNSAAGAVVNTISLTTGANTFKSFEVYSDGTTLFGYSNSTAQFSAALPAAWAGALIGWRVSMLIKNRSAAARTMNVDYVYSETTFTTNR